MPILLFFDVGLLAQNEESGDRSGKAFRNS